MTRERKFDDFNRQLDDLNTQAEQTAQQLEETQSGLESVAKSAKEAEYATRKLGTTLSTGLKRALDDMVLDGASFKDAFSGFKSYLSQRAYDAATKPVTDHFGSMLADGMASLSQNVTPFAKGGVVSSAMTFPMAQGTGLMGEAGPEAIMPLTRGADGSLGVKAAGGSGGAINVVMNISTPNVESFQRSSTQIAQQMSRALSRANRTR